MPTDDVPLLSDPLVVENRLYLRTPDGTRVMRPPSPPLLMSADGAVAASFGLYRHADGDFGGGGALAVTLDLGSPSESADEADAALPPDVQEVASPQHAQGWARLWFGQRELAKARLAPGTRPVVPMAARLDETEATLLRTMVQGAAGTALSATAGGSVVIDGGGVRAKVGVDVEAVRRTLSGSGSFGSAEAADAVQELLHLGAVRVSADETAPTESLMVLVAAVVAAALFDPVATSEPWSLVPGLRLPGYEPAGALRLRRRLRTDLTLLVDGTRLPWLAAAPLSLPGSEPMMWDLPLTRVVPLLFQVDGAWPAGLVSPGVEVWTGDGPVRTLPLPGELATLRLVPPPDWSGEYSWRVTGSTGDGTRCTGPWVTSQVRRITISPQDLRLDAD